MGSLNARSGPRRQRYRAPVRGLGGPGPRHPRGFNAPGRCCWQREPSRNSLECVCLQGGGRLWPLGFSGRLWFSLRATVAEGISAFLNLQGCSQQDRLHLVVLL